MDRRKLQEAIKQNRHFTESRKVSLYSNFSRLEETNPDGYEANIAAWKEVLEDAVRSGSFADATCIQTGPKLVADLSDVRNGAPLSLNCVIDRMVEEGSIVPLTKFQDTYPATPRRGMLSRSSRALGWVFGTVFPQRQWSSKDASGDGLRQEKYVDIDAVSEGARTLVKKMQEYSEENGNNLLSQIFSEAQVRQLAGEAYSALDIECFLSYASANNLLHFDKDLNVAKMTSAGPITDTDSTITSLRTQISELSKREESLAKQIEGYEQKAREAIKTNRKLAKSILQKKQGVEKSHDRASAALDQLESVLHKIDDASDNKQAFEALQSSSTVLSQLNSKLSIDDVDGLIERLQEAVSDTDEVTSSLADLSINGKTRTDREMEDLELDDELEQLEEEETAKKVSEKLPSAPQHKPTARSQKSETSSESSKRAARKVHADRQTESPIPN